MLRLSLLVIVGSGLGGLLRYWMAIGVAMLTGPVFPWGTLLINVLGSLVIGLAASTTEVHQAGFRAFLMVGVCGGFTTFSSFSLQTMELVQVGRMGWALAYMGMSVALCLLATWSGWLLGQLA